MSYAQRIRRGLRGCRPKLSIGLLMFEDGFSFDLFGFLIALPFMDRWRREPKEMLDRWGVYHMDRAIWLWWGDWHKVIHLPWEMTFIVHEVRRSDGTWVKAVDAWDGKEPDGRAEWTFPYTYKLRSGELQVRSATVHVERREWRQRWLKWTRLFAKVRTCIDVRFSDEVGERTGSWKGGCIGCGWELKPGETPEQCLRRMELERVFD